jgi:hypothetical protein
MGSFLSDNDHVVDCRADVFCSNIFPSQDVDEPTHGTQQCFCLVGLGLARSRPASMLTLATALVSCLCEPVTSPSAWR